MISTRIAVLILAHRNPELINKLIRQVLDAPGEHGVFVHIDAKTEGVIDQLISDPRVHILEERVDVRWVDISQVEAMLALLRTALEDDAAYMLFSFRSGQDLASSPDWPKAFQQKQKQKGSARELCHSSPSKSGDEKSAQLHGLTPFAKSGDEKSAHLHGLTPFVFSTSWFSCRKVRWDEPFAAWFRCRWPKLTRKVYPSKRHLGRMLRAGLLYLAKRGIRLLPNRNQLPKGWSVYHGTQWVSLARSHAEFLMQTFEHRPEVMDFFRETLSPEERIFHTVLMNSEYVDEIINEKMHYEVFDGNHPKVLSEVDLDAVSASGKPFSRKWEL